MKTPTLPHRAIATGTAVALAISLSSCRKRDTAPTGEAPTPAIISPELMSNQTSTLSSPVYQSQVKSPIHWQTWSKDSLERAREARRLVFCMVAMPQHNSYMSALESLSSNDECVGMLNDEYVPILVDADAARELSILSSDLCAEIREPVGMPIFMWLTHEGNPVAWIPVAAAEAKRAHDLFMQSHIMISQMWRDDPAYVIKNSRMDNENRRTRLSKRKNIKLMSQEPAKDLLLGLRQLSSLYDPVTRNFDETGGLFPTSSLELLAARVPTVIV
ncbi:MAG: DUF255 domain-containing protein, partial [Luteolibacter sp.]